MAHELTSLQTFYYSLNIFLFLLRFIKENETINVEENFPEIEPVIIKIQLAIIILHQQINKNIQQTSKIFNESHFEFNNLPSKIIAITNSISDKFPVDSSFRPSRLGTGEIYHRNFRYNYLGTRNRFNSFSNKALMNRALEIVFESY